MKRILITGYGSYIGTNFENWISQWPEDYHLDIIDVKDNNWSDMSFSTYDVLYHIAAIVHIKERSKEKYFSVNRDLTSEIAKKAKIDGIKQFIFLSTMGVYGKETGVINFRSKLSPKTLYAQSKLEAERKLIDLESESFKVVILRPPIVYGKDCRGNYPRLANMVLKLPIFPNMKNERSMIYINNLSEFVRIVINKELSGLFLPQNSEYVNTTQLALLIAKAHGKSLKTTCIFNPFIKIGIMFSETLGKIFGSYIYQIEEHISIKLIDYQTCSFEESILKTEN